MEWNICANWLLWQRELKFVFIEKGYSLSIYHDVVDWNVQEVTCIFYKLSRCMLLCVSVPDQLRMWGRHQSQLEAFSCLAKSGKASAFNCNIHSFSSLYDQWLLRYHHVTAEVFTFMEDIKLVIVRNRWALSEIQEVFYLLGESKGFSVFFQNQLQLGNQRQLWRRQLKWNEYPTNLLLATECTVTNCVLV